MPAPDEGAIWDPDRYLAFADLRSRPGLELMTRISHPNPTTIIDLGCGPGHLTAVMARRWPEARTIGVDGSETMLARAATLFPAHDWPSIDWQHGDIANWVPIEPASIVFSNAALHWVPDHRRLFRNLMASVLPGGTLAVQMPDNWDQPSHVAISRLVDRPRWRARAAPAFLRHPVAEASEYRAWLGDLSAEIDQWRTTYFHVLDGPNPVLEWVRGSVLAPVLTALDESDRQPFEAELANLYRQAYPPQPDGTTIFPFSRIFVVAIRR
ncbi:MAG: methyltransferase domain-containing protein [Acidimicrobiia bacterium]